MKPSTYRILTIVCMVALIIVSVQPVSKGHGASMPRQVFNNMLHIPAYGLLTFLLIKSAPRRKENMVTVTEGDCHHITHVPVYIISFLFALAFGIFNEYLQSFVPGRCVSAMDVALDAIGSLFALAVIASESKRKTVIARSPEGATKQSKRI